LRIIGGRFRGRRLTAPPGYETRPMLARVREALYNILADRIAGARVADCFSGTGAIGLEALSRGAASVDFFEAGRHAIGSLERNIKTLGVGAETRVHRSKLPGAIGSGEPWDVVVVDPPWGRDLGRPVAARVVEEGRITPSGVIVVSERHGLEGDDSFWAEAGLAVIDRRRYGDSALVITKLANPG